MFSFRHLGSVKFVASVLSGVVWALQEQGTKERENGAVDAKTAIRPCNARAKNKVTA